MKKGLTLGLTTSFLLGFAASALAVHGDIPAETSVIAGNNAKVTIDGAVRLRGYNKSTDTAENSSAGYDTRVRLGVHGQMSDATKVYVQLENGSGSGDNTPWGISNTANLNSGGEKTPGTLEVLQAWINYEPGMFGMKVGHMPLALGTKLFFDHTGSGDDAIVAYMNPSSDTHIALLTIKFVEGATATNGDDINGYVALVTQKMGDSKLGFNITNLYQSDSEMNFYNLGLDLALKAGPASIAADLEYQMGDVNAASSAKGYAATLEASMAAGPVGVGVLVAYGTGDDMTDADTDTFVNFLTDTRYQSTMVGYVLANPATGAKNTGIANMLLLSANVTGKGTCPISGKAVSMKARVNYMTANEVAAGASDDIGIEFEGFVTWKLDNGLSYGLELAYLMAGDAWKVGSVDPEDAWFLRNTLELAF
ncbi:MAG: hypothetical protein KKB30_02550 [Proteobacteria bacterium]|nr:hypothetical protein [Pseudomonadota bacterium]MBU1716775.1 hypothetical protein [Pseudomonadota bacterium]